MAPVDILLAALVAEPGDDVTWLALADCLEEQGREREAELTRLREWLRTATPRTRGRRQREHRLQQLLSDGVLPVVPQLHLDLARGIRMTFCLIPPGTFWMGSPEREPYRYRNEGPRHKVYLSRGFWMGKTPITTRQWQALNDETPSRQGEQPATRYNWEQIRDVCRRQRRKLGHRLRLPTEAEWEYACRAATRTPFYTGSTEADAHRAGWHKVGQGRPRRRVALKEPNAWGLYDMHGGVWEWCLDGRREYRNDELHDPAWELHDRTVRVLRGGSFDNRFNDARSSCRGWAHHHETANHWGARLALSLGDDDPLLSVFHAE